MTSGRGRSWLETFVDPLQSELPISLHLHGTVVWLGSASEMW